MLARPSHVKTQTLPSQALLGSLSLGSEDSLQLARGMQGLGRVPAIGCPATQSQPLIIAEITQSGVTLDNIYHA